MGKHMRGNAGGRRVLRVGAWGRIERRWGELQHTLHAGSADG